MSPNFAFSLKHLCSVFFRFWRFEGVIICAIILFGFSLGCDCRSKSDRSGIVFMQMQGMNANELDQTQKDFDRTFSQLNELDATPCLTGTPGGEKLTSLADRLEKWIRDRNLDESWKPFEPLIIIQNDVSRAASNLRNVLKILSILQGNDVIDVSGQKIVQSESLQDERQEIIAALKNGAEGMSKLTDVIGTSEVLDFGNFLDQFRAKFENLSGISHLDSQSVRAFAKQLESDQLHLQKIAEMLEKLEASLTQEGKFIQKSDINYLFQSIWFRDLSHWSRGHKQSPLDRAINLFDWTVCNIAVQGNSIQLSGVEIFPPAQFPWQTALLGYGNFWDRTWVFLELLRHQKIDACLLAAPESDDAATSLIWGVGVLVEGELYVFLPSCSTPLPGPKGLVFADDGTLQPADIATLSQVIADHKLLQQLDVPDGAPFPITAEMIEKTRAILLVQPASASQRMKMIESNLKPEQSVLLYTDPHEQIRRFSEVKGIKEVVQIPWNYSFLTEWEQIQQGAITSGLLMQPFLFSTPKPREAGCEFPLWAGRVLYLKGDIQGQESAMKYYQEARISDRDISEFRSSSEFRMNPMGERSIRLVNVYADYWLGVASFEITSLGAAKDFLTSIRTNPLNSQHNNLEYILGRIEELRKNYEAAISYYQKANRGTDFLGCQLRIFWLEKMIKKESSSDQMRNDKM
ncbi:MAG: hypothetical protein ACRCUY_03350 [Thermoguttaceae bacterium]